MSFEWDDAKATANPRKHGVSFPEAETAFADPLAAVVADPDHSDDEDRELLIGYSFRRRLLFVSFTERPPNVRIISARKATPTERRPHENNLNRGQP